MGFEFIFDTPLRRGFAAPPPPRLFGGGEDGLEEMAGAFAPAIHFRED